MFSNDNSGIKADVYQLGEQLEENQTIGDEVIENCYKIRMAITSKNKGKSGGARVITHVQIIETKVYLLSIYDKSEQDDISDKDLDNWIKDL